MFCAYGGWEVAFYFGWARDPQFQPLFLACVFFGYAFITSPGVPFYWRRWREGRLLARLFRR